MQQFRSFSTTAVVTATCLIAAGTSMGCVSDPPTPPPEYWKLAHGPDPFGREEVWVGQEVTLFQPPLATTCACGLNLALPPLPPGAVDLVQAGIFIVNRDTHEMREFLDQNGAPVFPFAPNSLTENGLNQFSPGGTWFGFSGVVNPFALPVLAPNEVVKLLFLASIDKPVVPFQYVAARTAGGEALAGGIINPTSTHIFQPVNPLVCIPSPHTFAIAGLAMVLAPRRRRPA